MLPSLPHLSLFQRALQETALWRWKARRFGWRGAKLEFVIDLFPLLEEMISKLKYEIFEREHLNDTEGCNSLSLSTVNYRSLRQLREELAYFEQFGAYLAHSSIAQTAALEIGAEDPSGTDSLTVLLPIQQREFFRILQSSPRGESGGEK